jgi:acyl-CoA reductase-like NAD-dependent aldehyde dehydrogenase
MRVVKDEFAHLLGAAMQELPTDAMAVSNAHVEKAKATIDGAVKGSAKYLVGNGEMTGTASIKPSILTDVEKDAALSIGEAFAPMAFLVAVEKEEKAITEANSRIGGLSAAVFYGNYERGLRIAREPEFGMVNVNNMTLFAECKFVFRVVAPRGNFGCLRGGKSEIH